MSNSSGEARRWSRGSSIWGLATALITFAFSATAFAQIQTDGTMGAAQVLSGPNFDIPDALGARVGDNLFHSFRHFNVNTGETATFSGPSSIENVISRVTGGTVSNIDGALRSTIPDANLFLINPTGMVFGPNATLDVPGSFYATTADHITFPDGGRFDASNPPASVLSLESPEAFGFLGDDPGSITITGGTLAVGLDETLSPLGETLSLVSGPIDIDGGQVLAPRGRIEIASVASAGTVVPNAGGDLDVSSFDALGEIALTNGGLLSTKGDPGGTIMIRGGQLVFDNAASPVLAVTSLNAGTTGSADGADVGIDIDIDGDVVLLNSEIVASSFGDGKAGDIQIAADRLRLTNIGGAGVSGIASRVFAGGDSGSIHITTNSVEVSNSSVIGTPSFATGNSRDITIETGSLLVEGGPTLAFISTSAFGAGDAGNMTIIANGVRLVGGDGGFSGLSTQVTSASGGSANAGVLRLTTESLEIVDGAQISASLFSGSGLGGIIEIVADTISISGRNLGGFSAGIFSSTEGFTTSGPGGEIRVTAKSLEMTDSGLVSTFSSSFGDSGNMTLDIGDLSIANGALIGATNFGAGFGGDVTINADSVTLAGPSPAFEFTGVFSLGGLFAASAGDLSVTASEITILDGAQINAETAGFGPGGTINIIADTLLISGFDATNNVRSGVVADTFVFGGFDAFAFGVGGNVNIDAGTLQLANRGLISANSSSFGNGGSITIDAGKLILSDNATISAASTLATSAATGGDVTIHAGNAALLGGSVISTSSAGTGDAGDVFLDIDGTFQSVTGSVTTQTTVSDGGDVIIRAGLLFDLLDASVTTSVGNGLGDGGNISIDATFFILDGSQIQGNAFGGAGGNILIVTGNFLVSPDSTIEASSALGINGTIVIETPDRDVSQVLIVLSGEYFDAASQFAQQCSARRGQAPATFVGVGRGGLPVEPNLPLPSYYAATFEGAPAAGELAANRGDPTLVLKGLVDSEKLRELAQAAQPYVFVPATLELKCTA